MLPWNLLKSSSNFTTYLSAYSVFLSSIAGVMVHSLPVNEFSMLTFSQVTDYYVIHKGHYRVRELYYTGKDGWYMYKFGFNLR